MASAQLMKEFTEVGERFGLKAAELQTFVLARVKEAQDAARNERAAERARREEELDLLNKKAVAESKAATERLAAERARREEELDF